MSSGCPFCCIARGEAPAHRVCEDARTLAFLDLFPARPGHVLVIPKAHVADLYGLDAEENAAVAETVRRVGCALREALAPDGLAVVQRNGAAAGQSVFHHHVHLIPQRARESLALHSGRRGDDAELGRIAAAIAATLDARSGAPRRR